ncbi:hypothetical protein ACN2EN_09365 [Aliarcobacter lanthieri]|uniref:hypothetical protein n=1 Tax=Aliarcobacter lanthieri TaxID=1355374 RepID=UPI003AFB34E7
MNINSKLWVKIIVNLIFAIVICVCSFNYIVDPYGIYNMNFFESKPKQASQMRLVKLLEIRKQKPISIVIGTSRADMSIDPEHEYFIKPSYNFSNAGLSIYEAKYYVEEAIKIGVKNILFVADWRMFNDVMKKIPDFESYFDGYNKYKFLLNYKTLEDSFYTIMNQNIKNMYFKNGLLNDSHMSSYVDSQGGHLSLMKNEERVYYKIISSNHNLYKNTNINSFSDFNEILDECYKNNINLDIVFGPSHIRQWEAFAYYKNYETLLQWKKDIILNVESIANKHHKKPFRVMDFSVYHKLTAEEVPTDSKVKMQYHWEGSHYKKNLGNIVLDRLIDKSNYKDFGVIITSSNIDTHIEKLRDDRIKFINIKKYIKEVFDE